MRQWTRRVPVTIDPGLGFRMVDVRKIEPADVDAMKTVRLESLRDSPAAFGATYANVSRWSDADWERRIATLTGDRSAGYLAWDGLTPCGLAIGVASDDDPAVAGLISMWVAPTHRRGGVGRRLVESVAGWARSHAFQTLRLHVTSINAAAIPFYDRLGFVPTGRTMPYPNDPDVIEIEMDLAL